MAVRLTQAHWDDTPGATVSESTRGPIGRLMRSRFGFSLLHATLRKDPNSWIEEPEVPRPRLPVEPARPFDRAWTARPLEVELELRLLLRGHPVGHRV